MTPQDRHSPEWPSLTRRSLLVGGVGALSVMALGTPHPLPLSTWEATPADSSDFFASPPSADPPGGERGDGPERFKGQAVLDRIAAKAKAEGWARLPTGERMGRVGLELVGTPYVAFTLETEEPVEYCTVDLEGLDCVTFFESTLGMARVIPKGLTRERLIREVRRTRYRGGEQRDYTSRLHYTMDWIFDNAKKGVVKDLTPELPGARPFLQRVGYMSAHPSAYAQLKANPSLVPMIATTEYAINHRDMKYVPSASVAEAEPLLRTGDIIGLCATQAGIDIAHTGIAYRDAEGVLCFFDATNAPGRMDVRVGGRLSERLSAKSHTGIVVARPL